MQINEKLAASQIFSKDCTYILSDLSLSLAKNRFKENLSVVVSITLSYIYFLDPLIVTVRLLLRMC